MGQNQMPLGKLGGEDWLKFIQSGPQDFTWNVGQTTPRGSAGQGGWGMAAAAAAAEEENEEDLKKEKKKKEKKINK